MIQIKSTREVKATLVSSREFNVPHCGLVSNAIYQIDDIPFKYSVTMWNRHAPVEMIADIVSATISGDAPMVVLDCNGNLQRDENGNVEVTRTITVLCPKSKDTKLYWRGYGPTETIQHYVNHRLLPTTWGSIKGLVEKD